MDESEAFLCWSHMIEFLGSHCFNSLFSSACSVSTSYWSFTGFGNFLPRTLNHELSCIDFQSWPSPSPRLLMCCSDQRGLCRWCHRWALHIGAVGRLTSGGLINGDQCLGWGWIKKNLHIEQRRKIQATDWVYVKLSRRDCTLRFYKYFNIYYHNLFFCARVNGFQTSAYFQMTKGHICIY